MASLDWLFTMGAALLACRVLLAIVFLVAGVAKLADFVGARRAAVEFGAPDRLAGVVARALPVAEIAVAVALIPLFSARFGALGGAVVLLCFSAAIAIALAQGRSPDCHCFGQVHSAPAGWRTLARNLLLLAVAGFVAIAGWSGAGVSATAWVTRVGGPWLVVIVAGLVIVALVSFQVWFSLQLLSQNGRTLARLEALEAMLRGDTPGRWLGNGIAVDPGPLGHGLSGAGIPVAAPAPPFELEGISGERVSLGALLGAEHPLMLVFSASGCGPCEALLPRIARWQREHEQRLRIAVVASGDPQRNVAKAREHGLSLVLLEEEREVSTAYRAHGTPMAVVIGSDGLIQSPTVGGSEAIATLIAQATRSALTVRAHPAPANGHGNGLEAPRPSPPSGAPRVGEPAPELVLTDIEGNRVALNDLYSERTLAIFWNPGCGFCQQMLPELRGLEDDPTAGAPRLVVISAGERERVREQQLRSRVVLDSDGRAMRAFGVGGTPMAVLIDARGKVASTVVAGAPAVLAAARGDPQPVPAGG